MKKFFYQDFIGIFQVIINSTKKELDISIDPQFEQFLCDFYKFFHRTPFGRNF